jgi:hypothetical protein
MPSNLNATIKLHSPKNPISEPTRLIFCRVISCNHKVSVKRGHVKRASELLPILRKEFIQLIKVMTLNSSKNIFEIFMRIDVQ